MGDELPSGQAPHFLESTENYIRDSSPHSLLPANSQQIQSNMEIEGYQRQQFGMSQYSATGMDLNSLAQALPDYGNRPYQPQPFQQQFAQATPSLMYNYNQGAQFAGQTASTYNPQLAHAYTSQFLPNQHGRQQQQPQQHFSHFMGSAPGSAHPHPFTNQNFVVPQPMAHNLASALQAQQQQQMLQPAAAAQYGGYGMRSSSGYSMPQLRLDSSVTASHTTPFYQQLNPQPVRRSSSNSSLQASVLRGPPRKPKQSGHALWVGNLPPGTHIIDLKDHFSRDATEDIESVFLISKSNCAFVNYKTESSCAAAMSRFHDSRFQGVRLVCRLRRGSTPTTAATPPGASSVTAPDVVPSPEKLVEQMPPMTSLPSGEATSNRPEEVERVKEKFFVVKSLTIEDLERSMHSGVWATQAHNEAALNKAYQSAEDVYLIFSANKSGEYFGYARMESAIDDEAAATIEYPIRPEAAEPNPADLPLTIPTPATATAPRGRIIDDSARGTIFWEADQDGRDEHIKDEDPGNLSGADSAASLGASPATSQTFGKPFKISWMSTDRLPFYRTRGLRNPWNANREVKIARDGTEIEPSVGRRLVNMFHRPQIPSASPVNTRQQPGLPPQGGNMGGGYMSPPSQMAGGGMYDRPY